MGVRFDLQTNAGRCVVWSCISPARRDLVVYDEQDVDRACESVELSEDEGHTLGELLGGSPVLEHLDDAVHRLEDLVISWIKIDEKSSLAGLTLTEAALRKRTGAGIVALVTDSGSIPIPGGTDRLEPGDTAVVVGVPSSSRPPPGFSLHPAKPACTRRRSPVDRTGGGGPGLGRHRPCGAQGRLPALVVPAGGACSRRRRPGGVAGIGGLHRGRRGDRRDLDAADAGTRVLATRTGRQRAPIHIGRVHRPRLNFAPGLAAGLLLGFDPIVAVLLGGITYISSSGIVAKLVADLDRIGNHETPVVLSVLVIEDLAMVLYLPIVSGVLFGGSVTSTVVTVAVSLAAVLAVLAIAYALGDRLSAIALSQSSEALLLTLLGVTLLGAGIAGRLNLSTAVGAFVVGVALSGDIVSHARGLLLPLRNLFAAVFFVFFGLQVDTGLIPGVAAVAAAITVVSVAAKIATGWIAAGRAGIGTPGRLRTGAALVAHGEFSIVIAELGISRESDLGALSATYVIMLTVVGALLYQFSDVMTSAAINRRDRRR